MNKKSNTGQDAVILPRSEKHYHIIVNENMHRALKAYAAKYHLSMYNATTRLIQLGITAELSREKTKNNPDVAEIHRMIKELAKQSLK
jgi:hypothetical protein